MRSPDDPIRERKHRLPPQAYRGHVAVSFTINTKDRRRWFEDAKVRAVAVAALEEAFHRNGGHAAVFVFMPDHLHLIVSGNDHGSDLLRLVAEFKQKTCFRLRKEGMQFALAEGLLRSPHSSQRRLCGARPLRIEESGPTRALFAVGRLAAQRRSWAIVAGLGIEYCDLLKGDAYFYEQSRALFD